MSSNKWHKRQILPFVPLKSGLGQREIPKTKTKQNKQTKKKTEQKLKKQDQDELGTGEEKGSLREKWSLYSVIWVQHVLMNGGRGKGEKG